MTDEKPDLGGRPSIYSNELRDEICRRLADGESLRSICRDDHIPSRPTIARWAYENTGEEKNGEEITTQGFYYHYTRARDVGLDVMADDIIEIGDESGDDWIEKKDKDGNVIGEIVNKEAVMRSRLRSDNRKWYLSKMAPKKYGNERTVRHQQLDGDGKETDPVTPEVNIYSDEITKNAHKQMEKILNDKPTPE